MENFSDVSPKKNTPVILCVKTLQSLRKKKEKVCVRFAKLPTSEISIWTQNSLNFKCSLRLHLFVKTESDPSKLILIC